MAAIRLRNIHQNLIKHVLEVQREMMQKKGIRQYSQELTVLQIIKEHMEMKESVTKKQV